MYVRTMDVQIMNEFPNSCDYDQTTSHQFLYPPFDVLEALDRLG